MALAARVSAARGTGRWVGVSEGWEEVCWQGQSGSGFGQIGQSIVGRRVGGSLGRSVGMGVDGRVVARLGRASEPTSPPPFPCSCICSLPTNSSNRLCSVPHISLSTFNPSVIPFHTATSFFNRSLSAFNALATSCNLTLEWISSASYCLSLSSNVVM